MKATLKGTYGFDIKRSSAVAALALSVGDCQLKALVSDKSFANGLIQDGVVLGIEKPDSFLIDYYVKEKDFKFQFMNTVRLAEMPLKLAYTHDRKEKENTLKGTLELNPANNVSAKYRLCKGLSSLKYSCVLGGLTTIEPSCDFQGDCFDLAVSQKIGDDDEVKAKFRTSSKELGVQWTKNLNSSANFKISASVNLGDNEYKPEFSAETTWDFDV